MDKETTNLIKELHRIHREGLDVPTSSVLEYRRYHKPVVLKEGLIRTYPANAVCATIARVFNLSHDWYKKENAIGYVTITDEGTTEERIKIQVLDTFQPHLKSLIDHLLKYGWFPGEETESNGTITIFFEKKFGDRYTVSDLKKETGRLFHITSSKLVGKLRKEGLIPKDKMDYMVLNTSLRLEETVSDRIYFLLEEPSEEEIREWGVIPCLRIGGEPMLVTVDLSKVNQEVSFFVDPRWRRSVFTYEPITTEALTFKTV